MAGQFYGVNLGQLEIPSEVLTGTSTTSADIEVQIVTTSPPAKVLDVVKAFNLIIQRLTSGPFNPTPPSL